MITTNLIHVCPVDEVNDNAIAITIQCEWLHLYFADAIGEYILRGASSVVLSDAIFDKEAIEQLNFDKIHKLARSATLLGNKAVNR